MKLRDPGVGLRQMLDHTREAVELMKDRTRHDLSTERTLQLSLTRLLEIVGEAANRIPQEIQARHSGIRWNGIIALRNRLIHGYESVDYDVLWTTVNDDLPPLITELERILDAEYES